MRRIFLAMAILLTGISGLATAQDIPPPPTDGKLYKLADISDYAGGIVNYNDNQSAVWFDFSRETDWVNGGQHTLFRYGFYEPVTGGARWGNVTCDVPNNSVSVTQNRATFSARVTDPSVGCEGHVMYCVAANCTNLPWTDPAEVVGYMAVPEISVMETGTRTETNTFEGVAWRFQCQSGYGEHADAGGVSVLLPGTEGFLYFAFDSDEEAPDVAHGQYSYRSCRAIVKASK